jgi:hypothetical protein
MSVLLCGVGESYHNPEIGDGDGYCMSIEAGYTDNVCSGTYFLRFGDGTQEYFG